MDGHGCIGFIAAAANLGTNHTVRCTPAAEVPDWGYFGRAFYGARIERAGNEPTRTPECGVLEIRNGSSHGAVTVHVALLETYLPSTAR